MYEELNTKLENLTLDYGIAIYNYKRTKNYYFAIEMCILEAMIDEVVKELDLLT